MKKLAEGAEAIIYLHDNKIIKERIRKLYRHPEIDEKLRRKTTRFESRLLEKASKLIPVPKLLHSDDKAMKIEMEFIEGKKLRDAVDYLTEKEKKDIFNKVGLKLAKLHNANIIHGDLTTSNIILREKVYFIDFGLGFISERIEDKAVDLRLLRKAIQSKHYNHAKKLLDYILEGYKSEIKEFNSIIKQLEKVEGRGRYRQKAKRVKSS